MAHPALGKSHRMGISTMLVPLAIRGPEKELSNHAVREDVVWAVSAWLITFCLVCIVVLGLGFGPAGVVAGRLLSSRHRFLFHTQV